MNRLNTKEKVFIIAELSANHNNDLNLALDTITAIAASGADAVKVQTFKPSSLTLDVDNIYFGAKKDGLWKGFRPYELFESACLPYEWHSVLKGHAENLGLIFFSTPFDIDDVDFLEELNIPIYKIASLEINHVELIKYVAKKNKPIILSTGVGNLADINLAVDSIRSVNANAEIYLLKCTSEYPAQFKDANLLTIKNMKNTFNLTIGVSDHTLGATVPIVAVSLGARIVEKHFILDRSIGGLDSAFSMEPQEFKKMVLSIREAEECLGSITYDVKPELKLKRRSLFFVNNLAKGQVIQKSDIKVVRPGYGLEPIYLDCLIGSTAKINIEKGTPVSWTHFI